MLHFKLGEYKLDQVGKVEHVVDNYGTHIHACLIFGT
jgi:hypothetical protein